MNQTSGYDAWRTGSHEAVATSLLDLKSGIEGIKGSIFKRLEDVTLTVDRVQELFKRFFTFFHPFLPFLDPERPPQDYHKRSPLLFWSIIYVGARHYSTESGLFSALGGPVSRLMWQTFAEVPQNYHVVKALILLCSWPFPTNSTSTDSTFIVSGIMMQIALQIGLHRPNHAQDFTKFRIELRDVEIQDRTKTWAVCNIVAQRIATSFGQPASAIYDWALVTTPGDSRGPSFDLPSHIYNRLLIEKFADRVSQNLYTNDQDAVGIGSDQERAAYVSFLTKDLEELEQRLQDDTSPITALYLRAVALHLRLNVFFSSSNSPSYRSELLKVYQATVSYLEACLSLESNTEVGLSRSYPQGLSLMYAPAYVSQLLLAAGFSLLKLMQTFLRQHDLDLQGASELLTRTVWAIRSMSVAENDLCERLAEVLAQVWKSSGPLSRPDVSINAAQRPLAANDGDVTPSETSGRIDDSMQLKVRCRMSMSIVFDSVWRWRQNYSVKNSRATERALKDRNTYPSGPTDPNLPSAVGGEIDPNISDPTSSASMQGLPGIGLNGMSGDVGIDSLGTLEFSDASSGIGYQVFDPLNWMLDGVVDFPYTFGTGQMGMPSMEGEGAIPGVGIANGEMN